MNNQLISFVKRNIVLCLSAILAVLSMLFVPPNKQYIDYIDFRVLALLFSLMLVVAALNKIGLFSYCGKKLISAVSYTRPLIMTLVFLCFFTSMFITNDVALLTFVPFTIWMLKAVKRSDCFIHTIVLQTIAANLGSMLTPIGNPQNLYLYSLSKMSIFSFFRITFPITLLAGILLWISIGLWIKNEPILSPTFETKRLHKKSLIFYLLLFIICLLTVVHLLPWFIMLSIIAVAVFIYDKTLFSKVDYGLLATFLCFFIFIGNLGEIPFLQHMISKLLLHRELFVSVMTSQFVSNVPAAILLSKFSQNYTAILVGVNIGGLGTLIASLASLISYRQYTAMEDSHSKKYIAVFTGWNIIFLLILLGTGFILYK